MQFCLNLHGNKMTDIFKFGVTVDLKKHDIPTWKSWSPIDDWCIENIGNIGEKWQIRVSGDDAMVTYNFSSDADASFFTLTWS
jgi:hypothetical protein